MDQVILLRLVTLMFGAFLSLTAVVGLEAGLVGVDATHLVVAHDHRRSRVLARYLRTSGSLGGEICRRSLVLLLLKQRVLEG